MSGAATVDRQWVVTAYTLAFGSLLLPGGRAGPPRVAGRRWLRPQACSPR
jgi:hypothetical protein